MDKFDQQQLRSIIQDERFRAIEKLQKVVIAEIASYQVKSDTEFETLWRVSAREAGVQVLEDFFKRMIMEASKSDDKNS